MQVRKAHIINPEFEVFSMLSDRQRMTLCTESEVEMSLELLLVSNENAVTEDSSSTG